MVDAQGQLKPKVTIGICARNSQQILRSAIESAVRQDFPHELMEIVFVDDGSEDRTLNVMKEYASKIDIPCRIYFGEWKGLGKARNTVINNARGEYIVWLDADETLEEDFVRTQLYLIESNPKAAIVTARVWISPGKNAILTLDLLPSVVEYSTQNWRKPFKSPGTGGATYRLSAAKQVGGFDDRIRGSGEDIDIALRIKQAGWLIISGSAKFYELHGGLSTWKDLWKRYQNQGAQARQSFSEWRAHYSLYKINPLASAIAGLRYSALGYAMTKLKVSLVLPVHFTFKMIAWFYGFSKASKSLT